MDETIGIIGLGNAGASLATALARYYPLVGYDLDQSRRTAVAGIKLDWANSVGETAGRSSVLMLSLPHPDASQLVIDSLVAEPGQVRMVVETSTITPKVARKLAEKCRLAGIGFLDAAIVGGLQAMAEGEISFLLGGSEEDFNSVRGILEAASARIFYLGGVGSGSGAKIVNNAVMHAVMVVLLEAGAMASKLDIPVSTLVEIMSQPQGLLRPLIHRLGQRVLADDYAHGMSVTNARKDSILALETAQDLGVPLFATLAAHTPFEIAQNLGYGDLDYAVLARLWEQWCDIEFADSSAGA